MELFWVDSDLKIVIVFLCGHFPVESLVFCFFFKFLGVEWGETESTWYVGDYLAYCTSPDDRWWWVWSSRWNENYQGRLKHSEKTCPSVTLFTTYTTWSDVGSNPGNRGGKLNFFTVTEPFLEFQIGYSADQSGILSPSNSPLGTNKCFLVPSWHHFSSHTVCLEQAKPTYIPVKQHLIPIPSAPIQFIWE
jgi:hypothetical protein